MESSDKFAPKCKILASSNEVILTYWHLKITFFTFCICDTATSKLLNYFNGILLIIHKNVWMIRFLKKWIKNIKITLDIIAEARIFFSNIVELLLFLYYTSIIQLSIVSLSIYSTIFKTISFQNVSNVSNATKLHHESFMQSNTRSIQVTKRIKIFGILHPHSS